MTATLKTPIPDCWIRSAAIALVSLPLLAELIRKYLYPSNVVLGAAEALAVLSAAALTVRFVTKPALALSGAILALISWQLMSVAIGHQNLLLGLIGLRNFVVPCAYLLIGVWLSPALRIERTAALLYATFTAWLVVIGVVIGLQLLVGRDHWLNALPEDFGDERAGIGDYTVDELSVEFLFRPTSIFLHTGKSGAVIFILTAYRLIYSLSTEKSRRQIARSALLDVVVLLLSGQRAAMLGYIIVVLTMITIYRRSAALLLHGALASGVFAAIVGIMDLSDGALGQVISLLWGRFVSGIGDIPWRIQDNLIEPMAYVWQTYALRPAGIGAFSLGATYFGGRPLYEIVPVGTAENSWLRILAEEGIVGLLVEALFWTGLCFYAIRFGAKPDRNGTGLVARRMSLGAGAVLGVLLFWANTHDVLGNTTAMSLSMVLVGATCTKYRRNRKSARARRQGSLHGMPVERTPA